MKTFKWYTHAAFKIYKAEEKQNDLVSYPTPNNSTHSKPSFQMFYGGGREGMGKAKMFVS